MNDTQSIFPIILNERNLIPSQFNNRYRYVFPQGGIQFRDAKIIVSNVNIYYSWENITQDYNNNSFSFTFPARGNFTVNIPNGYYSVSGLNSFLQQFCVENDLYLVNANGDFVYYIEFVENATYYSIQINLFAVPTSLPVGWTNPGGFVFPGATLTPQIIIPNTPIQEILGISAGTYPNPAQSTNFSKLSDFTPQISPVQSIILTCSLLNNKYSIPNTVLYSFTSAGTVYGSIIEKVNYNNLMVDIQDGLFSEFEIQFLDQNFRPLKILDPNLVVQLLIRN